MEAKDLKDWRSRMGWTQPQAAQAMGYTVEHISRMETGKKPIKRVVELACKALESEK